MPTLVILAAGRSTRFGSPKQTTPVGPSGQWLCEYALADARRAGFDRAVVVVRAGTEPEYTARLVRPGSGITVQIVPQRTGLVPPGVEDAPRPAPWGTAHAVLAARPITGDAPLAVVNADDFYGADAYARAAGAIVRARETGEATIVAMRLADTLSPHGPVTRAVCRIVGDRVVGLEEVPGLERREGRIGPEGGDELSGDTLVSMNCWVLPGRVMAELADRFVTFARQPEASTREFLLPAVLSDLAGEGRLIIQIVAAPGPWFGLTHAADRAWVEAGLARLQRSRNSTTDRTSSAPNDSDSSL